MSQFTCDRCVYCCKNFDIRIDPLDKWRIRMAGYKDFTRELGSKTYLKKTGQGCIFLEGRSCKIYKSRPYICRAYPSKNKKVLYCDGKVKRMFEGFDFWEND